ncbi:cytochrome c [uncultured Sulfitobacter sp.]|uniref:c-type cytochrome n=1 Tax=uncultured Sulfitobacter sp. TaxID=191468 RepID=UPI002630A29D|nr:cytochrome c [uncultured Sulfitobacter sp.]
MKFIIAAAVVIAVLGVGLIYLPLGGDESAGSSVGSVAGAEIVSVTLPDTLTQNAQIGQRAYDANCASCHGINAAGQEGIAPPLVHIIYEPSHHADESFQRAVSLGVRAHHWPFGDMPAVDGLTRGDVTLITAYIRELQRANGIN